MILGYRLDEDGEPVPFDMSQIPSTGDPFNDPRRQVARTEVGEYRVSTVFIVIDHNFSGTGPPVLWETMVFRKGSYKDLFCYRYSSRVTALAGHRAVVAALKAGEEPEDLTVTSVTEYTLY